MKFIVEDKFWEVFPEVKIGIITALGIDNKSTAGDVKYKLMLKEAEEQALTHVPSNDFSSNPVIKVWREAFQKFKTKKGVRASIEALLKRVDKGDHIGNINPLVDIYNSISLKYAMPCGGEDMDKFEGDMRLTKAKGDEEFITLGSNESASPYPEEIVYKDDGGAICRCWNWREAVRTMLTEDTKNAFLCIELVDLSREAEFNEALNELSALVCEHLGGKTEIKILDKDNPEVEIF
ncbi:MAG: B3/B4 domain-containing protein [Eubacteriales bacterium]